MIIHLDLEPEALRRPLILIYQGHYKEALALYDDILAREPSAPVPWCNRGHCLWQLGFPVEAFQSSSRAIELRRKYPEAWNNKAVILAELGLFDEALELSNRSLKLNAKSVTALINKALTLRSLGRLEESLVCYKRALKVDPESPAARALYQEGEDDLASLEDALQRYDVSLAHNPRDVEAWISKGETLTNLYRVREAISCFDTAIRIDPAEGGAWFSKGMILRMSKRPMEAIDCLDRAIELGTDTGCLAAAWHQKGRCLAYLDIIEEAVMCYQKSLDSNPGHLTAWFNKALAEERLGRWKEAAASYRWGLERHEFPMYAGQLEYARERLQELETGEFEAPE